MEQAKNRGIWSYILLFALGLALIVITYGSYQDDAMLDEMSTGSPVVCMKITARTRGAETVKYPCKVYADYRGKTYQFEMGSKSFRKMLGVDTIEACLNTASGRAFLPISGRVTHYMGLYFLIGGGGVLFAGMSIKGFVQIARAQPTKRHIT